MKVKCPKCRFRFDTPTTPGMTEVQCNCPRCGTPFTYSIDSEESRMDDSRSMVSPSSDGSAPADAAIAASANSNKAGQATHSAHSSVQTPPPPHSTPQTPPVPPRTGSQTWAGGSSPVPYNKIKTAAPQAVPKKPLTWFQKLLIGGLALAAFIIAFVWACDTPSASGTDSTGMTYHKGSSADKLVTDVQSMNYDSTKGFDNLPMWIQGQWHLKTDYGDIDLKIHGDQVSETTDGKTVTGNFKYQDHIIFAQFGSEGNFNYRVVEETHQIDCGNGMLMTKVE